MSAIDEGIVREYFEQNGFLVRQVRKYQVQARRKTGDEEVDLVVYNPAYARSSRKPEFFLFANELAYVHRAIVVVKGWHTGRFTPNMLKSSPEIFRFLEENVLKEVTRFFPVDAETLLGLGGFPATHPRSLGMMGMHGEAWVNRAIQEADLIVALGMRFDDRVTGDLATYAPLARKIHVELDPAEINKNVKVDLPIVGDVREVLRLLTPKVSRSSCSAWLSHIETLKGDSAVREIQHLPDTGKLYAAHVINDIWRLTQKRDTIVVTDVGQHQMWEAQYFHHDKPRSLITSGGLGTMGFALPAAIGAKFACPEKDVWVVVGDGGFQMTSCELATAEQEGIKVNVAIINNAFLGMVRQWQEFFYDKRYAATPMTGPDFVKLAEAYRLKGLRCNTATSIAHTPRGRVGSIVLDELEGDDVDAIIQVGTNLSTAEQFPAFEQMLGKPCIPINVATAWHAVRSLGIKDRIYGRGRLFEEF